VCITDAYVSERQRFNLLFLPHEEEPLRFRLLDDVINAVSCQGYRHFRLETFSFVGTITVLHIRTPGEFRAWYDNPNKE